MAAGEAELYDFVFSEPIEEDLEDQIGEKLQIDVVNGEIVDVKKKYAAYIRSLLIVARAENGQLKEENEKLKKNLEDAINSASTVVCPDCNHHFKERHNAMKPKSMKTFGANKAVELQFHSVEDLKSWLYLNQLETNKDGLPTVMINPKKKEAPDFLTTVGSKIPELVASKLKEKEEKVRIGIKKDSNPKPSTSSESIKVEPTSSKNRGRESEEDRHKRSTSSTKDVRNTKEIRRDPEERRDRRNEPKMEMISRKEQLKQLVKPKKSPISFVEMQRNPTAAQKRKPSDDANEKVPEKIRKSIRDRLTFGLKEIEEKKDTRMEKKEKKEDDGKIFGGIKSSNIDKKWQPISMKKKEEVKKEEQKVSGIGEKDKPSQIAPIVVKDKPTRRSDSEFSRPSSVQSDIQNKPRQTVELSEMSTPTKVKHVSGSVEKKPSRPASCETSSIEMCSSSTITESSLGNIGDSRNEETLKKTKEAGVISADKTIGSSENEPPGNACKDEQSSTKANMKHLKLERKASLQNRLKEVENIIRRSRTPEISPLGNKESTVPVVELQVEVAPLEEVAPDPPKATVPPKDPPKPLAPTAIEVLRNPRRMAIEQKLEERRAKNQQLRPYCETVVLDVDGTRLYPNDKKKKVFIMPKTAEDSTSSVEQKSFLADMSALNLSKDTLEFLKRRVEKIPFGERMAPPRIPDEIVTKPAKRKIEFDDEEKEIPIKAVVHEPITQKNDEVVMCESIAMGTEAVNESVEQEIFGKVSTASASDTVVSPSDEQLFYEYFFPSCQENATSENAQDKSEETEYVNGAENYEDEEVEYWMGGDDERRESFNSCTEDELKGVAYSDIGSGPYGDYNDEEQEEEMEKQEEQVEEDEEENEFGSPQYDTDSPRTSIGSEVINGDQLAFNEEERALLSDSDMDEVDEDVEKVDNEEFGRLEMDSEDFENFDTSIDSNKSLRTSTPRPREPNSDDDSDESTNTTIINGLDDPSMANINTEVEQSRTVGYFDDEEEELDWDFEKEEILYCGNSESPTDKTLVNDEEETGEIKEDGELTEDDSNSPVKKRQPLRNRITYEEKNDERPSSSHRRRDDRNDRRRYDDSPSRHRRRRSSEENYSSKAASYLPERSQRKHETTHGRSQLRHRN